MSATNDDGLELFDEAASAVGNFPSALRGYDRTAVDDYVRSLEGAIVRTRRRAAGLDEQLVDLQDEVKEAREKQRAAEINFTNLGARASEILRLAEEQAREVLDNAKTDGERMKELARREADQVREQAQRERAALKASGLAEIEQVRARGQEDLRLQGEKTAGDGQAILAAARREAEALRLAAEHDAQTLRENTYLDTEGLRRSVENEVAQIRQDVAHEREVALGHLKAVHDDAVTRTGTLLAEATAHHGRASEQLATDVAEAARIRAEALAEAEQVRLRAAEEAAEQVETARVQAAAVTERTQQEFAWRKQQLRRDTDLLGQRKQAVLSQLASLSALAEQTAHNFPDLDDLDEADEFDAEQGDRTVLMPQASRPALPPQSGERQSAAAASEDGQSDDEASTRTRLMAPVSGAGGAEGGPGQDDSDATPTNGHSSTADSSGLEDNGLDNTTLEIDGDATVLVPADQLPAGTEHLRERHDPASR